MEKLKLGDTRQMQANMKEKSLGNSWLEFEWQTKYDRYKNIKGKYSKDRYKCPHCPEGKQPGGGAVLTPLTTCRQSDIPEESYRKEDCSRERVKTRVISDIDWSQGTVSHQWVLSWSKGWGKTEAPDPVSNVLPMYPIWPCVTLIE